MSRYGQVATMSGNRYNSVIPVRKKMKLSIKEKIRSWLMNDDRDCLPDEVVSISTRSIDSQGFRLQVYKANGGIVVEARTYDRRNDEDRNSLYVITEDKDLGEEIAKIITMENLK
jgi:hypothetical protein